MKSPKKLIAFFWEVPTEREEESQLFHQLMHSISHWRKYSLYTLVSNLIKMYSDKCNNLNLKSLKGQKLFVSQHHFDSVFFRVKTMKISNLPETSEKLVLERKKFFIFYICKKIMFFFIQKHFCCPQKVTKFCSKNKI